MGMDLYNADGDYFRWNGIWWADMLNLAEQYGWQKSGTVLQQDSSWCGTYLSNDGQCVTTADAANLASALECALPALLDEVTCLTPTPLSLFEAFGLVTQGKSKAKLLSMFGGENKKYLKEFIAFCRKGGFEIY